MRVLPSALLVTSAAAVVLPRQDAAPVANSSLTGAPTNNDIPVFNTHSWPLLQPQQALAALHAKATQDASAVHFLPGVPLPNDWSQIVQSIDHGLHHDLQNLKVDADAVTEQWLEENVPRPENLQPQESQRPKHPSTEEASKIEAAADATGSCAAIETHYEWNNLTPQHKQQFLSAIQCLMRTAPRSGLPGVRNRWDDLAAIHQNMAPIIHNVGQFLPWHRYFLKIFEMELRNTCGYTAPMTWWNEVNDAGHFQESPLATSQYFGHFPDGNAVCIISGVFAGTEEHIGPGSSNTNHCLSRGVNEGLSADITQNFVNTCNSYNDYEDMNNCAFFGPHAYCHDAIGGVMSDVDTSPGDPVFFMHHAFIDHNWRLWQNVNPTSRVYAIGGFTTQNCGNNCQPTELNYVLSSYNFYPSVTVQQVMDTEGPYLCYRYDY